MEYNADMLPEYDINGSNYKIAYSKSSIALPIERHVDLHMEAIQMYVTKTMSQSIQGEGYEGVITKKGPTHLGTFAGIEYEATVDTDKGTADISFLVCKRVDPSLN